MNKVIGGGAKNGVLTQQRNERLFNIFTYTLVVIVTLCGVSFLYDILDWRRNNTIGNNEEFSLDLSRVRDTVLPSDADESRPRKPNCRFWDCLDLYRCGRKSGHDRLTVYVYPLQEYVDGTSGKLAATFTNEYYQILESVVHSPYYVSNPNEACLFLPSLDLLNQNLFDSRLVGRALASLEHWGDDGRNHIILNMLPGIEPHFNRSIDVGTDAALIMGGGFDTWTFRAGFDISLPVWSPALQHLDTHQQQPPADFRRRKHILVAAQANIFPTALRVLEALSREHPTELLLLKDCDTGSSVSSTKEKYEKMNMNCRRGSDFRNYLYPSLLSEESTFCLLGHSLRLGQPDLLEMLAHNCIPVVAVDNYVLPFDDVLDWTLATIRIRESELHAVLERLRAVSPVRVLEMREHGRWLYQRYFKSLRSITMAALDLLEGRIFPHRARSIRSWNTIDSSYRTLSLNPLFLPLIAPKSQGFTAVILTYDRVESLFTLIQKLALVPSLQSILVVWNNQRKAPPHLSTYPSIAKPLKVIQTRANKLSNRFYPYAEIETEAILTIDDDIVMLTADELDFGFEVWREFPDRIVGFPSRIHMWDNVTMRWHYESEWTNQISMVLTGAAFHHKFWSHMYTYAMPGDIKEWVDEHMNCEDIAMNFLVSNVTNKPPIKVTPRKKFKCPECTNTEMLSADLDHMRERSVCINRFAEIYGRMSLRSVEFRADPVLFKDNFPEKLKRFNDVGSL